MLHIKNFQNMRLILFLMMFIFISQCSKNDENIIPKDVKGWGKANWGMTEKELLGSFKGEAVLKQKVKSNDEPYDFIIEKFLLDNEIFSVFFVMDANKRLNEVNLNKAFFQKTETEEFKGYFDEKLFRRIQQNLILKYGKPTQHKEDREPDTKDSFLGFKKGNIELETIWVFPTTEIKLSYGAIFWNIRSLEPGIPTASTLNIRYKSQKSLRDKL